MDFPRLQESLETDYALLVAAVEAADPAARVPTCPDWSAADLADHVSQVYLHKAECMRLGREPDPWPPERGDTPSVDLLRERYAALQAQFADRLPGDYSPTWCGPDQSVGFWIRRMAQETVIHRIDAQLTAGSAVDPVPADVAVDGIDELLLIFLAYQSVVWREDEDLAKVLASGDGRPMLFREDGGHAWLLTVAPTGAKATALGEDADGAAVRKALAALGADGPALTVRGPAFELLCWLWNRPSGDAVEISGDPLLLAQLHGLQAELTQ